jgi:hypothetical protein
MSDTVWTVIKWVLLVLAAGFVGQFGKSLALRLIERRRRKKVTPEDMEGSSELEKKRLKELSKLEKKRIKAQEKKEKKS